MTAAMTKKQLAALYPSEHAEQARVVTWCLEESPQPIRRLTRLIYAVPNQGRFGGRAAMIIGKQFKAEGLRKGFPDLCLPVPVLIGSNVAPWISLPATRSFELGRLRASLYIEMKRCGEGFEGPSAEQLAWHEALRELGHCVYVAPGASNAIRAIEFYLAGAEP
jgi:hypothetical protein